MSSGFERIASRTVYEHPIITVREDRFRYDDGEEADRVIVAHNGAVAVVAHDDEHVYLVRQPREAAGATDMLELPAGKLDEEGEGPDDAIRRELAEEVGKAAEHWELLHTFFSSVGISTEQVHLYLATGLSDVEQLETDEEERIEIVPWPLSDLQAAIDECRDSKTLVGLLELRARL